MQTQVEEKNGVVYITATASGGEVKLAVEDGMHAFMNESGMQIPIDTDPALKQKMIESIGNDAIGEAVRESVLDCLAPFALTDAGVIPGMMPEVKSDENPVPGEPFTFTVEVVPRPEFELNSYHEVSVTCKREEGDSDEEYEQQKISAVTGVWASRLDRDVSPAMWRSFTDRSIQDFVKQLAAQGMTVDQFCEEQNTTREQMHYIMDANAHAALLSSLAMDALVRHYKIKPDKDDERRAALMLVPNADAEWAIQHLHDTGRSYLLKENAERLAATKWAMAHATITEV